MLVNESHLSNQHIQTVCIFLDSEFFKTELAVLAYFTHMVNLPMLYCVEVNTHEGLLKILPKLYLLCIAHCPRKPLKNVILRHLGYRIQSANRNRYVLNSYLP